MNWINDYIKFLGCVNPKELRIEEAMQLKSKNLPDKLYKYRAANKFAIANLKSDTVWLNAPSEYNDPFEFAEYIDFSQLHAPIAEQAGFDIVAEFSKNYEVPLEIASKARLADDPVDVLIDYALQNEGRTHKEISTLKEVVKQVMDNQHLNLQQWKIDLMQDQMKVCSFCESHEQLLMWSHYANYHTGFCVEYDISIWKQDDIRNRLIYPVIYQDHRYNTTPHLMQNLNGNDGFNPLYAIISGSTKSTEWSYEREWRFIFNIGNTFPKQNYQMNCQSKVFLGYRMEAEQRSEIIEICKRRAIPVYESRPSADSYKLTFRQIKC